jgi:hypothetical protein
MLCSREFKRRKRWKGKYVRKYYINMANARESEKK